MTDEIDEIEDDVALLQKSAVESAKLADGKIQFMAQHGVINPFAVMQSRVEDVVDWLIPRHVDDGTHFDDEPPTNPERLRFDIYCNLKIVANCDAAMGQTSSGLHVVKGHGVDG